MPRQGILILAIAWIGCGVVSVRGTNNASSATKPAYIALPTTLPSGSTTRPVIHVEPISDALRREYRLDPFYRKTTSIDGIVIIGSDKVSDYAVLECASTLDHMLDGRTMALEALVKAKVRVGILAVTEYTMDIPENKRLGNGAYNDRRSRGLGSLPLATCGEENLLNLRHDPYSAENITIHEFSHTVASAHSACAPRVVQAPSRGIRPGDGGGVVCQKLCRHQRTGILGRGRAILVRLRRGPQRRRKFDARQLKAYDPPLAALLTEVYGDGPWRYFKTTSPKRAGRCCSSCRSRPQRNTGV